MCGVYMCVWQVRVCVGGGWQVHTVHVCTHVQVMVLIIFFFFFFLVENLDTHVSTVLSHSFPLDVSILYSCWPVGYCLGTRGKNMLNVSSWLPTQDDLTHLHVIL